MAAKRTYPSLQAEGIIKVKVLPRSSRNQIMGMEGGLYKVKVTSPPVGGMANEALIAYLSKRLGVPKSHIEIISGKNARTKSLRIRGLSLDEIASILGE
ncbi:MAG: DUF167 domain-containing protein [Proteobacteria bacterium]|nr:DUF167 domain-containing protein [Pseudomonadota bacterium]